MSSVYTRENKVELVFSSEKNRTEKYKINPRIDLDGT